MDTVTAPQPAPPTSERAEGEEGTLEERSTTYVATSETQGSRKKITMTASRDLVKKADGLSKRYIALGEALKSLNIYTDDDDAGGLRQELVQALRDLKEAAPYIDSAYRHINRVKNTLESL